MPEETEPKEMEAQVGCGAGGGGRSFRGVFVGEGLTGIRVIDLFRFRALSPALMG